MENSALSRRAMLRVVSSAAVVSAAPAVAQAPAENLAGDIARLVERYQRISAERVEVYDQFENAHRAAADYYPPPPRALLDKDGDLLTIAELRAVENFARDCLGHHPPGLMQDFAKLRTQLEEYDGRCEAVDEARGVWALEDRAKELQEQMDRLEDEIIATPATTLAALRAKLLFADEFLEFTKNPDQVGVGGMTLAAILRDLEFLN